MTGVSGEASDARWAVEVQALVNRELERLGGRDTARLQGRWLIVGKGEHEARSDLGGTLAQWDSLPDDLRQRRARQIAELLLQGQVHEPNAAPRKPRVRRARLPFLMPLLAVLVMAVALFSAYRLLTPNAEPFMTQLGKLLRAEASGGASATPAVDPERERALLAQSACEQASARISRGATIGPADVEGWQIELVLLRRGPPSDLTAEPALARFIERPAASKVGTVIWPAAKSLVSTKRFDAEVSVRALPALGQGQISGLSLNFAGPYAAPYFSEELRAEYAQFADALADAVSASDGALFAHCAGADAHYIGSWFLGENPGAAVASLVYFMGAHNDAPVLRPDVLGKGSEFERRSHAFDVIAEAARRLDRGTAATLIGRELGTISGRPQKPFRLHFPFRDANRAARSSVDAARSLGLVNPG